MNIFIVYYHPEPKSFNGALRDTAVTTLESQGYTVRVSDLHAQDFSPISGRHNFTTVQNENYFKQQLEEIHATESGGFSEEIETELKNLEWCDLMIWQFPLWWFGLPAPLKGWVDRVFAMSRTYGNGKFYQDGVFKGKRAMLSLTTGGPEAAYLPDGFNGDIMGILRPIHRGMLAFVGFDVLPPHIAYGPAHLDDSERTQLLADYEQRLLKLETEQSLTIGTY